MLRSMSVRLTIVVFACLVSASALAVADQPRHVDVPAGSLVEGLDSLARQCGVDVIYPSSELKGLTTRGVSGTLEPKEAFRKLLEGTPLILKEQGKAMLVALPAASKQALGGSSNSVGGEAQPQEGKKDSSGTFLLAQEGQGSSSSAPSVEEQQREKEKQYAELQEVVVTGTHIHGIEHIESPTLTLTRQDIDTSGYQTLDQLVGSIPQNFNGLTPAGSYTQGTGLLQGYNTDNATAIDLRGLGPQSTLTLIDGQRVAAAIQGRAVDVSMIPLSMVAHVDVVTGGASSIYGADAVGGVVNIVLRHQFDGAYTTLSYGDTSNGGNRLLFSQILGHDFGRGSVMLGYDLTRDAVYDAVRADLVAEPLSFAGAQNILLPLQPQDEKQSVYLSGRFNVSDALELYADGSYVHKWQDATVISGVPSINFIEHVQSPQRNDEYGAIGGARASLGGSWKLDTSVSSSVYTNDWKESYQLDSGGVTNAGGLEKKSRAALLSGSAVADGDFVSAFGVQTKAAVGFDARRETLSTELVPATTGMSNIPFASRTVYAVFGEIHIPIVSDALTPGMHSLQVTLSGRDDHYSDFGNTFNPQAGILWQPVEALGVRGTFARAFRAPDLFTEHQGAEVDVSPFPVQLSPNAPPVNLPTLDVEGGNPNLRPERATSWSTGLDLKLPVQPVIKASLSYFDISYDERISTPFTTQTVINPAFYTRNIVNLNPTQAEAAAAYGLGPFVGNFSGDPWDGNPQTLVQQIPGLIIFDDRFFNLSKERLRGLDLQVETKFSTGIGELSAGLNGTRTLTHFQQLTSETPAFRIFNYVSDPAGLRLRASGGLQTGPVGAFLFVNYVGSYDNQYTAPFSRIGSWTTVDLTLQFDTEPLSVGPPINHLTVFASALNLLNRDPPYFGQNYSGLLFDPANASGFRRYLTVGLRKKW